MTMQCAQIHRGQRHADAGSLLFLVDVFPRTVYFCFPGLVQISSKEGSGSPDSSAGEMHSLTVVPATLFLPGWSSDWDVQYNLDDSAD